MTNTETTMREQILAAAKSLFIEQGYHGLAMRQISDQVGVTKAALYYHFKDKEELFIAILDTYLNETGAALDGILQQPVSCSEQIRLFVRYVLEQPAEQRAIIRLASQEMGQLSETARKTFDQSYYQKFIGKLRSIIQIGIERGEFRAAQPELITWALLGIMYPYFYPAHTGSRPLPEETIREISAIFLNGIVRSE